VKSPIGANELSDILQRKNEEIEQLRSQLAVASSLVSPVDNSTNRRSSQNSLNVADISDSNTILKALVF
jgi:hypothetical protein